MSLTTPGLPKAQRRPVPQCRQAGLKPTLACAMPSRSQVAKGAGPAYSSLPADPASSLSGRASSFTSRYNAEHTSLQIMPAASGVEVDILRRQVHELGSLVRQQQSMLTKQQEAMQRQQDMLSQQDAAIRQLRESMSRETIPVAAPLQQPQQQQRHPAWNPLGIRPYDAQLAASYGDRRLRGLYDARFSSTLSGAIPRDYRVLPDRIILVRHAQSEGNVDGNAYTYIPDPQVALTELGQEQARAAGEKIKRAIESGSSSTSTPYKLFFYTSPYKRSLQTFEAISQAFSSEQVCGVQEEVQLREQDFGNLQEQECMQRQKEERLRFGRFFYRFPNGESGADVYDRITLFEDHMVRDINAGRFSDHTNLVLVTHGLALRIFLMRWFHWTVDQFLNVFNPANAEPVILERVDGSSRLANKAAWMPTKSLYRLSDESRAALRGCSKEMATTSCLPLSVQEDQLLRAAAEAEHNPEVEEQWAEVGGGGW